MDTFLWLLLAASQCALLVTVLQRKLWRRLPGFALYAIGSSMDTFVLLWIGIAGTYESYYQAFYFGGKIISVLAFLGLIEIARLLLPTLDLPGKWRALLLLASGIVASVLFAWLWPLASLEKHVELGAFLVIAMAFLFLFIYSLQVGMYWSKLTALIAAGFLLRFALQAVAKAVIGHWPDSSNPWVLLARQLSMFSHILAVGIWVYASTSRWGEHILTVAEARKVENLFADTASALREEA